MPENKVSPKPVQPTQQTSKFPAVLSLFPGTAALIFFYQENNSARQDGGGQILIFALIVSLLLIALILFFILRKIERIAGVINLQKMDDAIGSIKRQVNGALDKITETVGNTHVKADKVLQRMDERINETARQMQDGIGKFITLRTSYIKNLQDNDPGYNKSLNMIKQAERRIWIIGDFSPEWLELNPPGNREDYLNTIEEKVRQSIRRNLDNENPRDFSYIRIIQRDQNIFERIKSGNRTLCEKDMVGDLQVYLHCHRVLKIKRDHGEPYDKVEVSIHMSPPIPNCPSILLVDDKCMLFTIPYIANQDDGGLQQRTDGVLFFEFLDEEKQIAQDFEKIISLIQKCTVPLLRVELPETPPDSDNL
ncbi:MAG: hypothetical protein L0220_26155 [Acidobacteria bacterium]|nr:hypothetical protein [Acidobacteriota bacterium]